MSQWIISSSVVVAAVLCLRWLLYDRISPRLRYGLWLLALLRLCVPFGIGHSVVSAAQLDRVIPRAATALEQSVGDALAGSEKIVSGMGTAQIRLYAQPTRALYEAGDVLFRLWLIGAVLTAAVMLYANVRFFLRLRRSRTPLETDLTALPVYRTAVISSPCLFGFPRPAVYINGREDEAALVHILAHENAHHRQGDAIWNVLRCVCLCLHWFHPLVWAAVFLSKRDAECAADALAVKTLGDAERFAYGRTLLSLASADGASHLRTRMRFALSAASDAVSDTKSRTRERITLLIGDTRTKKAAAVLLSVAVFVTAVIGFTGIRTQRLPHDTDAPETIREAALSYASSIFTESDENFRRATELLEENAKAQNIAYDAERAYENYRVTDYKISALSFAKTYDYPIAGRRLSLWYMEYASYADSMRGYRTALSHGFSSDGSGWRTEQNRYYLCVDADTEEVLCLYENRVEDGTPGDAGMFDRVFCDVMRYYKEYSGADRVQRTVGEVPIRVVASIASGEARDPYHYIDGVCYKAECVSEMAGAWGKEQLWRVVVNKTGEVCGYARYYPEHSDICIAEDVS